jgi:hypothetical protein
VSYNEETTSEMLAEKIWQSWFSEGRYRAVAKLDDVAFAPYTAREQALAIGDWFREIMAAQSCSGIGRRRSRTYPDAPPGTSLNQGKHATHDVDA